jgi:hypothetical protein
VRDGENLDYNRPLVPLRECSNSASAIGVRTEVVLWSPQLRKKVSADDGTHAYAVTMALLSLRLTDGVRAPRH